jgi:hypothetical protein
MLVQFVPGSEGIIGAAHLLHDECPDKSSRLEVPDLDIAVLAAGVDCVATSDKGKDSAVKAFESM